MHRAAYGNQNRTEVLLWGLTILPAVALGVIAMVAGGSSPVQWGQQAVAFIVFALLGLLRRAARKVPVPAWLAVLMVALAATLFFPAVGGARRWLDLGLINVNAAMLVLPALILLAADMKRPHEVLLAAAVALSMQPDLSQLAALSLAAMPLIWRRRRNVAWTVGTLVLLVILVCWCLNMPVALEPAAYSESVLGLLGKISPLLLIAGGIALAIIPGCFICRFIKEKNTGMLCLAVYYAVIILFSLGGEYPAPFMGFGLSPIAGYWLAFLAVGNR